MINKITKKMVSDGYDKGIIELINSDDGVLCQIGDYYFYFGGALAEGTTVKEYKKNIAKEKILQEIFEVLEEFRAEKETFGEEYFYYYFHLLEKGV